MGFSYKRSIGLVVLYVGITFSATANAITIVNYNSRAVDYEITEAPTCANSIFSSGKLGPYEGSVNWDNPSLLDPEEHLCLHVTSWTGTAYVANNLSNSTNCTVSIRDNGLFVGISLEPSASCH